MRLALSSLKASSDAFKMPNAFIACAALAFASRRALQVTTPEESMLHSLSSDITDMECCFTCHSASYVAQGSFTLAAAFCCLSCPEYESQRIIIALILQTNLSAPFGPTVSVRHNPTSNLSNSQTGVPSSHALTSKPSKPPSFLASPVGSPLPSLPSLGTL